MDQKTIDRSHRNRIRARDAEIEAFTAKLERILGSATSELGRSINGAVSGSLSELDGLRALADFEQVLKDSGLSSELTRLRGTYASELEFIRQHFSEVGFPEDEIFTGVDREMVEVLIQSDFNKVGNTIRSLGTDMQSVIARQVLTGQSPSIDSTMPQRALKRINTELHTGVAAFARTVTVKKAKDLLGDNPKFLYTGARPDGVIRDFCKGLLIDRNPAIYTLREIEAMDNNQGLEVLAYGGGYNCRHDWSPVTDELAEELEPQ